MGTVSAHVEEHHELDIGLNDPLARMSFERGAVEREEQLLGETEQEKKWVLNEPTTEPARKAVHQILTQAIQAGATDVHFERREEGLTVRFRVDGDLRTVGVIDDKHFAQNIVYYIKINSTIGHGKYYEFESGRAAAELGQKRYDLRIEKNPSFRDEEIVIRILDKQANWSIDNLALTKENLESLKHLMSLPYGLILLTGPTGCGKSTTMYAMLKEYAKSDRRKINTIEDPVEYEINGAAQVNVDLKQGRTMTAALRSFLRQNPNIIMVGEMRDTEVALTAAQAAETGHLVLSTLHTNDAPGAVVRLEDMKVPVSNVLASLRGVVAQRLIKRVNPAAWEFERGKASELLGDDWKAAGLDDVEVQIPVRPRAGVPEKDWYKGRIAVHEIMLITPGLRQLIRNGGVEDEIRVQAHKDGMQSMWVDGLKKVAAGVISLEALRLQVIPDSQLFEQNLPKAA